MAAKGGFASKDERENYLAEYVCQKVRYCEELTTPDRQRWELANNLFQGKQEVGEEREGDEGLSKVFIHEFSKICRTAASTLQDIILQDPEWYEIQPPPNGEEDFFFKTVQGIVKYRIEALKIERFLYRYALAGGIYGPAIAKLIPSRKPVSKPEIIIEQINKQEQEEMKQMASGLERPEVVMPEDDTVLEQSIVNTLDRIMGELGSTPSRKASFRPPTISKKKILRYCLELSLIDPHNFFWDPNAASIEESSWYAERRFVPRSALQPLIALGVLKKDKDKFLSETISSRLRGTLSKSSTWEGQAMSKREQLPRPDPFDPICEVIEFHGLLTKKTGEVIAEDAWIVVVNSKVVMKDAINPYWYQKAPYLVTTFSIIPFKAIGAGIADNSIDQQLITNQFFSLYLDHLAFSVLGVKGVNVDDLQYPDMALEGFRPGQLIPLVGSRKAGDSFHDLDYNENLAFPFLQIIEKLSNSGETAAGVDVTSSNPSSRARISARENSLNAERAQRSQFSIAHELDADFLEELVKRTIGLVLQFDFENSNLDELLEEGVINETQFEQIKQLPRIARFKETNRNYRVKVKGFRERLERNAHLSRLSEAIQQINQMPAAQDKIQWGNLIVEFMKAYRLDVEKLVYQSTPQDTAREENALMFGGRQVSVMPEDEHALHLEQHYQGLIRTYNEEILSHTLMHIRYAFQQGIQPPPPPKQLKNIPQLEQVFNPKPVTQNAQPGLTFPQSPGLLQ